MITIFIATYNRTDTLERTLASYRHLETPHRICVIDNGSDSVPLRELFALNPDQVYCYDKIDSMEELTVNYNRAMTHQYQFGPPADWYAVSDADICFEGCPSDTLQVYADLAAATGCAVGPHTRIDPAFPLGYPLRNRVLATESRLLYKDSMSERNGVYYSAHPIDTTFHLFPPGPNHKRLKLNTYRVGPPYDAMHLDWYIDFFNPTRELDLYSTSGGNVGSWGKNWISGLWRDYKHDPELMFQRLQRSPPWLHNDLDNNAFMLAWCYQVGAGTEQDLDHSRLWLRQAVPVISVWMEHAHDWMEMIYENEFSSLGWS